MITNEIRQLFRKMFRQKVFTVINIIGLSLGLVFSILAFLFGQNEYKYDTHFTNTNDTYLLACNNGREHSMHYGQPSPFMNKILENIPEVESGMRLKYSSANLNYNDQRFNANGFVYVDSSFFNFFGWDVIKGDPATVVSAPFSLCISESKAKQLFKDEEPIGKIINLDNEYDFTISGVFKDLPEQSHIKSDFFASLSSWKIINKTYFTQWGWHATGMYVKLNNSADLTNTETKIADIWNKETTDRPCTGPHIKSKLLPFSEAYLKSGKVVGGNSNIDFVIGFAAIAAFILLISCFNFINLSVANQSKHCVENGIKKVLGANVKTFTRVVLLEIFAYLLLALGFSYLILSSGLPFINGLLDKTLSLNLFTNAELLLFIAMLVIFIIIFCGSFPLLQILRSKTLSLLKGRIQIFAKKESSSIQNGTKNTLIISQFVIGILLVICSLTINKQLQLIRQHDAGFNKEKTLVIDNYEGDRIRRYDNFANALEKYPEIKDITVGSNAPFLGINNWGGPATLAQPDITVGSGFVSVNANYFKVIGAKFLQGRDFLENTKSEENKIIVTEKLVKDLGLDNPLGTTLINLWDDQAREIVGVVKNIEYNTIHNKSLPVVFFCERHQISFHKKVIIKLQSNDLQKTISDLNSEWGNISPDYPMEYVFLDDQFNKNYKKETQTAILMNILTIVAILLCCLGLFGLALFNINSRIKEVGIRKVNGAKEFEIIQLLNKDFAVWVIVAFVIASPIAYLLMTKWLQNFAYRTEMSWWVFLLSGIAALCIALLTVSWQTFRAARRNPVEALRYE